MGNALSRFLTPVYLRLLKVCCGAALWNLISCNPIGNMWRGLHSFTFAYSGVACTHLPLLTVVWLALTYLCLQVFLLWRTTSS